MTSSTERALRGARPAAPWWLTALPDGGGVFLQDRRFADEPPLPSETGPPVEPEAVDGDAQEDAWQAGYEAGFAAAAAKADGAAAAQERAAGQLRSSLAELDGAAQQAVAGWLAETVASLCGKVFGQAGPDTAALEERCHRAAAMLGGAADRLVLHLCPDDIALLDPRFRESWTVVPDEALPRGALRLQGEEGGIGDGPDAWTRQIREALDLC